MKGQARIVIGTYTYYCLRPLKMSDLECRGGADRRESHGIHVLPVDRPYTQGVPCGSTGGLVPTLLRAKHSFLVEK